jgi:hypothetical protein
MNGTDTASIRVLEKSPHEFMPWGKIINLRECKSVTPPKNFSGLFLLKNSDETNWLIGQYRDMTNFATALRVEKTLREFLSTHRIRIGLREADIPPANVERQESYGMTIQGENFNEDFTTKRLNQTARPVRELKTLPTNRKTDREKNAEKFWDSQTPQSHHIVEFNNLETLGASRKNGNEGMDYYQLPAVLLAAEFHQRYISAILKPTHNWGKMKLEAEMPTVYSSLYLERSKLFEPMWSVSKAIIERAGLGNGNLGKQIHPVEKNKT